VDEGVSFNRDDLIIELKNQGVDARVFFWPLSATPVQGRKASKGPYISEQVCIRALNLPSHHDLMGSDCLYISEIARTLISTCHQVDKS